MKERTKYFFFFLYSKNQPEGQTKNAQQTKLLAVESKIEKEKKHIEQIVL